MQSVVVLFTIINIVLGQGSNLDNVECPFPDGSNPLDQSECLRYTACEWTGSFCRMKSNGEVGYVIASYPVDTGRGFKVQLERASNEYTLFEEDAQSIEFEAIYHEDYHLQIKIRDASAERYEVPVPLNFPTEAGNSPIYAVATSAYGTPFTFNVTRLSNSNTIFKSVGPLTFENQFIQFTTRLMSEDLYGFGESTHSNMKRNFETRSTYAIFARDQPVGEGNLNEYGHHPYSINIEDEEGNSNSLLFFNSNAMEYSTFSLVDGTPCLTYRAIGGIIDLHFFLGPTPEDLNIQYTNMIGRPVFPPYWALGFQLSRWGYQNTDEIRDLRQRTKDNNIPQDVQVLDIDYMDRFRDFTIDPIDFADVADLVDELHQDGIKVVIILDPGIVIDVSYAPFTSGVAADVFIKWGDPSYIPDDQPPQANDYVVGYCWPDEKVVYPDFFKNETELWWTDQIVQFYNQISYDGLWIDMNEPANFGTDTNRPWNYPSGEADWSLKCPYSKLDSPPYPTKTTYTGGTESGRISDHSMCMSASQTDGVTIYNHYDVHSLYGWSQTGSTYRALEKVFPGKRQIVLSRSTFPSSGVHAVHWLGDNTANWQNLRMSIIGMVEFSMFGISFTGADVCGFFGEPTEELCARWTELGAFYPFNRNHNALGDDTNIQAPQDPSQWPSVAKIARDVYTLRYQYNPYLYSLLFKAHFKGETVVRPLFNVFPSDSACRQINDQFMWANGLMIAPIVHEGMFSRDVYFPQGKWYNLINGSLDADASSAPLTANVLAPLDEIPVYVRGGTILPFQGPAMTTTLSRLNPFGLTIAIDNDAAVGSIAWDDGESQYDDPSGNAYEATMAYDDNTFSLTVDHDPELAAGLNIETLKFYGYNTNPNSITVNGQDMDISEWIYYPTTGVLLVTISEPLSNDLTVLLA